MVKKVISLLVEGGNMKPGPSLGTTLGPLGINMGQVTSKINEATLKYKGLRIPVKLIIDMATKNFEVEVGELPVSQMVKREAGYEKGSGAAGTQSAGNLTTEQIIKIAKEKLGKTLSPDLKKVVKEIAGTCLSIGVNINGKNPKEFIEELKDGKITIE